jgi:hypothetical protein
MSFERGNAQESDLQLPQSLWFWIGFSAVMVVCQLLFMDYGIRSYDEGLALYGALRVLHGQLPYRDFWTMYGPGQFYLFALFFKLFGTYAVWGRVIFVLTNTLMLAMVFCVTAIVTRQRLAPLLATAGALIAVSGLLWPSYDFPVYQALALFMVATPCMVLRWRSGHPAWAAASGFAAGAVALFRHDIAVYAVVALVVSAAWFHAGSDKDRPASSGRRTGFLADLGLFCAAALVVVLPVVLWLLVRVPVHDLVYSLFYVPGRIYPKVRHLPFPMVMGGPTDIVSNSLVYLPIVTVAVALACLARERWRRDLARWQQASYLLLTLLVVLMFLKGVVRVLPLHMVQTLVPSMVLICCLGTRWRVSGAAQRVVLALGGCIAVVLLYMPLRYCLTRTTYVVSMTLHPRSPNAFRLNCHPPKGLERAACLIVDADDAQVALYLEQHTAPDQTIFIGASRHDVLFANKIDLYFLSKRESATKWHDLHPGVETTAPVQDEMIRELEANRAVYVVRDSAASDADEPNDSHVSSGVFDLDRYIDANYRLETRIGGMSILRRSTGF